MTQFELKLLTASEINFDEFIKLPGVGAYTAGAVLSISYNNILPAVDSNAVRVVSRLEMNNIPDHIISSGAERAISTACILSNELCHSRIRTSLYSSS